jgi:glycosyltransferase involved in cell wall biosynthesis
MTAETPVRILHVVGAMDRGGVETWLMHVLRNIDRRKFQMDFLVHTDRHCAYDGEIAALGSIVHVCPAPQHALYGYKFSRILRRHGPYDVVHSHVHHFSGFALALAHAAGVPIRIAHSHNDTASVDAAGGLLRRLYLKSARAAIQRFATQKIATSVPAAASLFGRGCRSDPSTSIVYCGLDFAAFAEPVDRAAARREFGFAPGDFVVGHVGRFEPQKNHDFLLHIHHELLKIRPEARLLLIGKGPLEAAALAAATRLGTLDRTRFAGVRTDIARLMMGVMDIFVMPSLYEGLGLVALEAQAAGLTTILSDRIPAEVDAKCGLVRFIPLEETAGAWASRIVEYAGESRMLQAEALAVMSQSHFNIGRSIEDLCRLYAAAPAQRPAAARGILEF